MTTIVALFDDTDDIEALVERLDTDDQIDEVRVMEAADSDESTTLLAGATYFNMQPTAAPLISVDPVSLDSLGLDEEVVAYFGRQLGQGGRLIIVDCNDSHADRVRALLEKAGGRTSSST